MPGFPPSDAARVAIVTGSHPFDVPAFHALFRAMPGIDAYVQHMEDWAADWGQVRRAYDATVFYNFHQQNPSGDEPWPGAAVRAAIEDLGATPKGIVVWHHALLAFPRWTTWAGLVGMPERGSGYHPGETLEVRIAAPDHPILRGVAPFSIVDESYIAGDPEPGCEVLLTTEHPKSMRTLAWTRQHGASRVVCMQLGHDAVAWGNPGFRETMLRSILWSAGRL